MKKVTISKGHLEIVGFAYFFSEISSDNFKFQTASENKEKITRISYFGHPTSPLALLVNETYETTSKQLKKIPLMKGCSF